MSLGPIVGIAGDRAIHLVAELPPGVEPAIEVREETGAPPRWTDEPDEAGWGGRPVEGARHERRGAGDVHRFTLEDLDPDRAYRYRFLDRAGGLPLPGFAGRFRPVPSELAGRPASFVLTSCNKDLEISPDLYVHPWRDLAGRIDADPGLRYLLHAGDQIYCDEAWNPVHEEFRRAVGRRPNSVRRAWYESQRPLWLGRYRGRYRVAWHPEPVRRVLRSIPNLMIWDDHDIHDGYGSRATDFWTFAPTLAGVAAQVFDEYQASVNPTPNLGVGHRGFTCRLLGCRLIVLDTRSQRDSRHRQVLGEAQWRALDEALAAHRPGGGPLLVVSSTPVYNFLLHRGSMARLIRRIATLTELHDDLTDAWDSPPNRAEMGRLLDGLAAVAHRGAGPVVILAGDIHVHHLSRLAEGAPGGAALHQVTSSPFTNKPQGGLGVQVAYGKPPEHDPVPVGAGYTARVRYFAPRRGYALLRLDPEARATPGLRVSYRVEDEAGGPFRDDPEHALD